VTAPNEENAYMIPDGYRVLVTYQSDKEKFEARVPELGNVKAVGDTRAEALAGAEEIVEKAFRDAAENGTELPKPIEASEFSGEISLQVSPSLHRELTFLASLESVDLDKLCSELLSAGVSIRTLASSRQQHRGDSRQNRGNRQQGRRGGRQGSKGYFSIMDDKASFIEYVRGLEGGGGGGNRGGGSRRGRGGRGRKS
jgi:predicted RNase H-like HicB family nuclease